MNALNTLETLGNAEAHNGACTPVKCFSSNDLSFWINSIGAPVLVVEKQSLIVKSSNRSAQVFFAMRADEFTGAPISRALGMEASELMGQIWSSAPVGETGEAFLIPAMIVGQERPLKVQIANVIVDNEEYRLFTFVDAPPQGSVPIVRWQEQIFELLNWVPFGLEISDRDDQIQFANSQFNTLFGYRQDELQNIENWWRLAYPDPEYRRYAKSKWEAEISAARAENREMTPFDLEVATAYGSYRTIQFRHRSIGDFHVNLYLDVTRERAYSRELKALADTDSLTGALNRRRFFENANKVYEQSKSRLQTILMLDIDHFKRINDTYGHATGDIVLKEFTQRCQKHIRENDSFARLGGEEFAILLDDESRQTASQIANRIHREVGCQPFRAGEHLIDITVSIGCAARMEDDYLPEITLNNADKVLYKVKQTGRNRVMFHDGAD